ncbi:MAG: hypothetical protein O7G85_03030, partial [Planctomycetota bacterium]|nr:hypothetical protein [Planctomycetota bacterium]
MDSLSVNNVDDIALFVELESMNQRDLTTSTIRESRCPRCGYDLRGVMATWESACDLCGTCTECGLAFEWGELLNPLRNLPRWCFEFADGVASFLWRCLGTILMMLRPWRFWTNLKMEHPLHWRRHIALHALFLLASYGVFVIALGVLISQEWIWINGVNQRNLVPKWEFVFQAMLTPWSNVSPGTFILFGGTQKIQSPLQYVNNFFMWSEDTLNTTTILLMATILSPLGFFTLPQSRREAKVRWAHILRIASFSMIGIWAYVWLSMITVSRVNNPSSALWQGLWMMQVVIFF